MNEMVEIGQQRLVGEVIELWQDQATIQVYEDTTGRRPGDVVFGQGLALFVELGPGLIGQIFDGIQRPLSRLFETTGAFIQRGKAGVALSRERIWPFRPIAKTGQKVKGGEIIGEIRETERIIHHLMVPPDAEGLLVWIAPEGPYSLEDNLAVIEAHGQRRKIKFYQRWPVRKARPVKKRLCSDEPLFTGQRVIDFFFPLAKWGSAAIPGGFGTGKTVTQHQLSKWADADIIVYIGCGERGNEMTGVLTDFPKLIDPRSKQPLIQLSKELSLLPTLRYASSCQRGQYLYRNNHCRILSRHGLSRSSDG